MNNHVLDRYSISFHTNACNAKELQNNSRALSSYVFIYVALGKLFFVVTATKRIAEVFIFTEFVRFF